MKTYFGLVLSACLTSLAAVAQAHSVQVAVQSIGPNQYQVSFQSTIQSALPVVWQVLTDYDHHAEFLPYMTKSRVIERTKSFQTVEQEGQIRVLFWTFLMRMTQRVTHVAPTEMRFQAVAGDFQRLEGVWRLTAAGQNTLLSCKLLAQPRRRVPEWAVRFTARNYLKKMVEGLQKRAEQQTRS